MTFSFTTPFYFRTSNAYKLFVNEILKLIMHCLGSGLRLNDGFDVKLEIVG